jgi:hypothetical protein
MGLQRNIVGNDDDNEKCCRICLQDDHVHEMIAPCRCRGSSQWVHRSCLDAWRVHELDRAFGRCTECRFPYRLETTATTSSWSDEEDTAVYSTTQCRRRTKFCHLVTRDLCVATVLFQLVMATLVLVTFLVVKKIGWPKELLALCKAPDGTGAFDVGCFPRLAAFYYLLALLEVLVLLGLFGSTVLCCNGCQIPSNTLVGRDDNDDTDDGHNRSHQNEHGKASSRSRPPPPSALWSTTMTGGPPTKTTTTTIQSSSGNGNSCNGVSSSTNDNDSSVIIAAVAASTWPLAVPNAAATFRVTAVAPPARRCRRLARAVAMEDRQSLMNAVTNYC